jgi:hypothetical protein
LEFIRSTLPGQSRFQKQKKTPETFRFQASLPVLLAVHPGICAWFTDSAHDLFRLLDLR